MIQFNLLIPTKEIDEILSRDDEKFIIITRTQWMMNHTYFIIEAEETEMCYFVLKYGQTHVWKR